MRVAHPPSASAQAAANAQALRCSSFVFLSLTLNPFQHRQKSLYFAIKLAWSILYHMLCETGAHASFSFCHLACHFFRNSSWTWLTGTAYVMPLGLVIALSFRPLTNTILITPSTSPVSGSYTGLPLLPG